LDGNTNTIWATAAVNPSHWQEFDNKESAAPIVAVEDDIAIYLSKAPRHSVSVLAKVSNKPGHLPILKL
jgi:hypothetical protein